jgi:hypothetical protein
MVKVVCYKQAHISVYTVAFDMTVAAAAAAAAAAATTKKNKTKQQQMMTTVTSPPPLAMTMTMTEPTAMNGDNDSLNINYIY